MDAQPTPEVSASNKAEGSAEKGLLKPLTESVAVVTGLASLAVALFWYTGRSYAQGYYGVMGIPLFQLNLSVWEYAEMSWAMLLLIAFMLTIIPSGLFFSASIAGRLLEELLFSLLDWIESRKKPKSKELPSKPKNKPKESPVQRILDANRPSSPFTPMERRSFIFLMFCFAIVFLVLSVVWLSSILNFYGQYQGRNVVLNENIQVEITSKTLLTISPSQIISSTSEQGDTPTFIYEGLRLLTSNNGNFYLFQEIDPNTCKPKEVYIINSSISIQSTFSPSPSIASSCLKEFNWADVPRPF